MAGWKVYFDTNNNGTLQENSEPFQVSKNQGYYEFTNLERSSIERKNFIEKKQKGVYDRVFLQVDGERYEVKEVYEYLKGEYERRNSIVEIQ